MGKRTFVFILIVVVSLNVYCQSDSLVQYVPRYYRVLSDLNIINPYEEPDLCIEKSLQVLSQYNKIVEKDPTRLTPQSLFVPYSMISYSYYGKKDIKSAIPYMEKALNIARSYTSQLLKDGYTHDVLIGFAELLRDAYTDTNTFDKALALSKDIISTYEKINPKHMACQQMAESQIYKKQDNIQKVIECDYLALDMYEKNGNDVPGFYSETIVNEILEAYLYIQDYKGALDFIDNNRERLNKLFQGEDDLEYEKLNQTNKYLYQVYHHIGLHQRAANAAILVSNYFNLTEGRDNSNYASWMNNAACSYMDLYESEDNPIYLNMADSLFNIAAKVWNGIPNRENNPDYATYLGNYGDLLSHRKEYEKAETLLHKSLALYENNGVSENTILSAKYRLASNYGESGRISESISIYKELYDRYLQKEDTIQLARICNRLSQIYWIDLNDIETAERYANLAVDLITSIENPTLLSSYILENFGRVYYKMGLEQRALEVYARAIDLKLSLGVSVSPYEMLNLYEFYIDSFSDVFYYIPEGRENVLVRVEQYCKGLIADNEENSHDEKVLLWKTKTVLAKAYMFFKKFEQSENEYLDLLKIEEELWGTNSSNYIVSLNNLAYCYALWGNHKKCREISLKCVELDPTNKNNYENILSSSIALNDIKMVERFLPLTFNTSLDYLKSQFLFLSAEQREEFIESISVGFSNLSLAAFAYPNNDICAEYSYNSALVYKGLLLNTQKDIALAIESSNNATLKKQYQALKQLENQLQMSNDSTDVVSIKHDIELQEKDILSVLRIYNDYTKNLNITYKDIQGKLTNNDIAIEFVEVDKSLLSPQDTSMYYGAVVLRKEWAAPKFILLSEKAKLDSVIKNVITEFKEANGYKGTEWISISNYLYNSIWEPIASLLHTNDRVYFSPVGMLSLLPMEILQDSLGHYLEEQYNLYRMSTTKYLCTSHQPLKEMHAILYGGLVYDDGNDTSSLDSNISKKREGWQYLPSTAEEIADINIILNSNKWSSQIYDKLNGTEESFKSLSGKSVTVIHLATHGFYFDKEESNTYNFFRDMNINVNRGAGISTLLRSGLMLSGGQKAWLYGKKVIPQEKEDGILLASEISLLDLQNVDLITLSACQTGLGDICDDGVMGLQRGFKRAGVNSLLMTLWPVEDSATKILMTQFYKNLVAGQSKRQSLLSAQKYLREYNNGYYNEPKYWAAFILLDGIDKN